jgi:hypothetical protein
MREPRRLTDLKASIACYKDSFVFYNIEMEMIGEHWTAKRVKGRGRGLILGTILIFVWRELEKPHDETSSMTANPQNYRNSGLFVVERDGKESAVICFRVLFRNSRWDINENRLVSRFPLSSVS